MSQTSHAARAAIFFFATLAGCGGASSLLVRPTPHSPDPSFLEQMVQTGNFRLGRPTAFALVPDGSVALFLRSEARSATRVLYAVDVATGTERVLATADALLGGASETLTAEERARRERMRLAARGIGTFTLSPDGANALVPLSGKLFLVAVTTGAVRELPSTSGAAIDARFSPDGSKLAVVRQGDVYVVDVATGAESRLTTGATEQVTYGLAEFVAQEEMDRFEGLWWSPDGARLLIERVDTSRMEQFHIADPAHPEQDPQVFPYPRAGGVNAEVDVGIVPVTGGAPRWISWDRARYPYLASATWSAAGTAVLLVQNRTQTEEALLAVDVQTGAQRELLVERDEAWLNLDQSVPHFFADGSFLWSSERSGAWQLERRNADGTLANAITAPELGYRQLLRVDAENVYVSCAPEPTETHVARVPLAGGAATILTSGAAEHEAVFASRALVWAHAADALDATWTSEVVREGGAPVPLRSVAEPAELDVNVELVTVEPLRCEGDGAADEDPTAPEPTRAPCTPVADASVSLRAAIVRPKDFVAGQKYPVIVQVYGGPHYQSVRAVARNFLLPQWMANHGYVVVSIDGRGTPSRGRAFERVIKNDVISAPLADQIAGLRALGARFPELDLGRVGITGWSFGGYFSAMAVLRAPHVFHAAFAGAPVTDWHDYDTHYTERYMGLPSENTRGYERTSALTWAARLRRPLVLVHGTADDNVYFLHTVRLSDALFRAGRPHDVVPLAGLTHMVSDARITARLHERKMRFFDEALRAVE